jgi:hypothetical protein
MTEEQKSWGGARPGAGRPRKTPPHFEPDQWALIAEALHEYASMNLADEENPYSQMAKDIEEWQKQVAVHQTNFDEALKLLKSKGVKGGVSLDSV